MALDVLSSDWCIRVDSDPDRKTYSLWSHYWMIRRIRLAIHFPRRQGKNTKYNQSWRLLGNCAHRHSARERVKQWFLWLELAFQTTGPQMTVLTSQKRVLPVGQSVLCTDPRPLLYFYILTEFEFKINPDAHMCV